MRNFQRTIIILSIAVFLLLALYPISYLALLDSDDVHLIRHGTITRIPTAFYRIESEYVDSELVETFYEPMHNLDCWLRPRKWEAEEVDEIPPGGGGFS